MKNWKHLAVSLALVGATVGGGTLVRAEPTTDLVIACDGSDNLLRLLPTIGVSPPGEWYTRWVSTPGPQGLGLLEQYAGIYTGADGFWLTIFC